MFIRYLQPQIERDLAKKLVLLSGPRQVGKTTLAKSLKGACYLNFDVVADRKVIVSQSWDQSSAVVVLDELHKLPKWKSWLKGVWDGRTGDQRYLVTGSARMDIFRRSGDSLAGRFFHHHLHPLSVREVLGASSSGEYSPQSALDRLVERGGFPEPFFMESPDEAARWRLGHVDRMIRDDLPSLTTMTGIRQLELLVEFLSDRVGSGISYANLANDLSVAPVTVKKWIELLELLYVVFTVRPYTKNLSRSLRKEPKIYFYDTGRIPSSNLGARFENALACHLLKRGHYLTGTKGERRELFYIRDKEGREVDFLTTKDRNPEYLIEAKLSDEKPSNHLLYYSERIKAESIQLVSNLRRRLDVKGVSVVPAAEWLARLEA
jgi:predicted AAA+ superfamily ATPase